MEQKKKKGYGAGIVTGILATVLVSLLLLVGFRVITNTAGSYASGKVTEKEVSKKLNKLNALIDKYYLYEDEIDTDKLAEGIYSGYTSALGDKYTVYYDEDETKALMESTSGTFSGVGATLTKDADTGYATIVNVYEDSPAEKAGLKAGDILEKIDDHEVGDEQLDTVVSWIKGEKGTEVKITVLRDGEELELTATRDTIEVKTVSYEMKENQIGYIRVSEFDTVTYDQFKEALDDLENQGMQGLIVDLRNNPGGSLDTVTNMLRLLLPEGTIVSTKDKNGKKDEITCDGTHEFKKPMAVLVNQYSASASEIFSGAVQDYGTAKIVGVTTYGKGVVQQLMDLGDGTCLKVTIAEYYTPNGRSINGKGVEPDVEVEYQYDEENPKADNQLDQALSTIQEEIVESTQNR
ncbi:S41 family peptidase [[Ruminococcus] torques]|uniref:S41 family peptidase n=1 Tax=[Ruminococcus] torques TaxID=33039 RepID=UPI0006C049DB|nr:S41 family peptidase [[Ruminococcus] torques]CUQ70689.1 Probable CtpA-like serine protease [[Ruminococcus] torques]